MSERKKKGINSTSILIKKRETAWPMIQKNTLPKMLMSKRPNQF